MDELNAAIGLARAFNSENSPAKARRIIDGHLSRIQNKLFDIGSILAMDPSKKTPGAIPIIPRDVRGLERFMDLMQKDLSPLRSFVLPGGGPVTAALHIARTVCRRAEREVLRLSAKEPPPDNIVVYLNRLSDFLFVLSRWASKIGGDSERLWTLPLKKGPRST